MAHIRLNNVDVDFPIYDTRSRRLLNSEILPFGTGGLLNRSPGNRVMVNALRGVSLDIESGMKLGLIGHNGAGKTTLLRVLAGIYHPTRGTIETEGVVSPMFDVALGMEPDATGYENIRITGMLLGMSTQEVEALIPDIEEFTELSDYLDLPIRTYSSGMMMRLAFAVATGKKDADILLLDEAIGTGDASFLIKAQDRFETFLSTTNILVVASHSNSVIEKLCDQAALIEKGEIRYIGSVATALQMYDESNKEHAAATS